MPSLIATEHFAKIIWLGQVADRQAALSAEAVEQMDLEMAGNRGEAHGGLVRPSCVRVRDLYPIGTEIRNTRQLSIVSAEELAEIAAEMGLEQFDPGWIGASVVIEGIADFSHVPPSARLQSDSGATVVIDMQNRPCTLPARVIEAARPGAGAAFKPAAVGRRGVTAWVERAGRLALGDRLRLFVPDQRGWQPEAAARPVRRE